MLCEYKLTNLVFKNQENSAKHNLVPFSLFFFIKKINKNNLEWNAWMLCNANPRNKKKKNKEQWSQRIAMKHKDHVKRTQLDWAFYIQYFLDAPQALEFIFTLEWFLTPRLE